jgi:hypothetical protein
MCDLLQGVVLGNPVSFSFNAKGARQVAIGVFALVGQFPITTEHD